MLTVSVPVMADGNGHQYIIRNNPRACSYSMEDHSYKAFKIFNLSWNGKNYDLIVNDNYKDFFKGLPGAPEKEEDLNEFVKKYMLTADTLELAKALGSYTNERCIAPNAATDSDFKVVEGVESLTIPNIDEGCYLVLDENGSIPGSDDNYGYFSIINVSFNQPLEAFANNPYTQTYTIQNYGKNSNNDMTMKVGETTGNNGNLGIGQVLGNNNGAQNGDSNNQEKKVKKISKAPHTYYVYKLYDITWDDIGWHCEINHDFKKFFKKLPGAPKEDDALNAFAATYAFGVESPVYHKQLRDYILEEEIKPITISQVGFVSDDNREYVQISSLAEGNYLVLDEKDCIKDTAKETLGELIGRHEYVSIIAKRNPNK